MKRGEEEGSRGGGGEGGEWSNGGRGRRGWWVGEWVVGGGEGGVKRAQLCGHNHGVML